MKLFLIIVAIPVAVHTVTFGINLVKDKQKESATGAFLLTAFMLGVVLVTLYFGRS